MADSWTPPDLDEAQQPVVEQQNDPTWAPPPLVESNVEPTSEERRDYFLRTRSNPITSTRILSRIMARGIPVIGNYVSETPETREERRMFPTGSRLGEMVGGVAATYPLAGMLPMSGNILKQATISGLFGGGLNLADAHTSDRRPQNIEENLLTFGLGAGPSAMSPMIARLFRPAGVAAHPTNPQPNIIAPSSSNTAGATLSNPAHSVGRQVAQMNSIPGPPPSGNPQLNNLLNQRQAVQTANKLSGVATNIGSSTAASIASALAAAGIGHYTGQNTSTMLGMAAAGALGPRALTHFAKTPSGAKYLGSKISPETMALLNAIGANQNISLNDNVAGQ